MRYMKKIASGLVRSSLASMLLILSAFGGAHGQSVHKCVIDGVTSFQSLPCPTDKKVDAPSAEKLNAEKKRRQLESGTEPGRANHDANYTGWPTPAPAPEPQHVAAPQAASAAKQSNSSTTMWRRGRGRRR